MKEIYCGTSGKEAENGAHWSDLSLDEPWKSVVGSLVPGSTLRPVQDRALRTGVLESRRHLVVSAPTNGGKSLVGHLVLLKAALRGRRAILLEPLRVLARDKWKELKDVVAALRDNIDTDIRVRLSTGDYRRENEQIFDDPPGGEIIVATPERLEAILRNTQNDDWLQSTGAVVVDEAHLIGNPYRGATLEYLVTFLRTLSDPPRIALLSATLGELDRVEEWMHPCDVISVEEREPPLEKNILVPEERDEPDNIVFDWTKEALGDTDNQVLIFVYRTQSAEKLASDLTEELGEQAGDQGVLAYHSRLGSSQREKVEHAFTMGHSRVVVTTTSLSMGVNFPATHVLIRDTMFYGAESPRLETTDLLQMMGRAGRGQTPGTAAVLVRSSSGWDPEELERELREEELPTLTSAFEQDDFGSRGDRVASKVAALLGRWEDEGRSKEQVTRFFSESLGGKWITNQVGPALQWLRRQKLAYLAGEDTDGEAGKKPGHYFLTALGEHAVKTMLPLHLAAGWAQLIRDLLIIDEEEEHLQAWRPLDHLLLLELTFDRTLSLRRFSRALEEEVNAWCEQHPSQTPILFRKWMIGSTGHSRAGEVLGSLGVELPRDRSQEAQFEWARRQCYKAMFRSLVIYERAYGEKPEDIARTYDVQDLPGVEEQWRDRLMWLLAGVAEILEIRSFYYHLREHCGASPRRVRRVKRALRHMRNQAHRLQDLLKYLSPLGGALRDIRKAVKTDGGKVGVQTMRRLEEDGLQSLKELSTLSIEEMKEKGVNDRYANQVRNYLDRRLRI
jgi:superfamily II DNA/RNA helicase